jgi:aspartate aminotransferase-like enzyme
MEAAMVNLTEVGDRIVVVRGGKFGDRWAEMGKAYGCQVTVYDIPWGASVDIDPLLGLIRQGPPVKALFFQANETSTGVYYPVEQIAKAVRQISDCLIIVDAISGLAAHKIEMDDWHIDCLLSGSQKGFGIPPGLAFIALSETGWTKISTRSKFYFDLRKERKGQDLGDSAWTPATTLIASLSVALEKMNAIGINKVVAHHQKLADALRASIPHLNLSLFAEKDHSNAVTAINVPPSLDGKKILKQLREQYGAIFAGGQDALKGKILRFSTLGFMDQFDVIAGMSALEMTLADFGHPFELGEGVKNLVRSLSQGRA